MAQTKRRNAQTGRTLRNEDYTDRELLANIRDAAEADGWASTTGIAVECGFSAGEGKTPALKVASRLSWMRDAGDLLESTGPDLTKPYEGPGDRDSRWRLTPRGQAILGGKLNRTVEGAMERLDDGAKVLVMRKLTQDGLVHGDRSVAFTLRREYLHAAAQRGPLGRQPR